MKSLNPKHAARLALMIFVIGSVAQISANAQQKLALKQVKAPAQRSMTVESITEAEQLLSDLGYWTGPIDGKMDAATRDALIAFQKVEGRTANGRLTAAELLAIRSATRPSPLETGYAHVEADLDRQVLFVVDDNGAVSKILPISSGNGEEFTSEGWTRRAITPTGRFKIYRKVEGWRKAPLGSIYYPNYFLSGVAIHGSSSVPARPASHGCIRIPVFAAKEFSEMTPNGTVVIVHSASGLAQGSGARTAQR
jgi:N-acetylmuramoyl-L-alanine amidase